MLVVPAAANLSRADGIEFLALAPQIGIVTTTTPYALSRANDALADLRSGAFHGAAVLVPDGKITADGTGTAGVPVRVPPASHVTPASAPDPGSATSPRPGAPA